MLVLIPLLEVLCAALSYVLMSVPSLSRWGLRLAPTVPCIAARRNVLFRHMEVFLDPVWRIDGIQNTCTHFA
jgi:hypothetical protein